MSPISSSHAGRSSSTPSAVAAVRTSPAAWAPRRSASVLCWALVLALSCIWAWPAPIQAVSTQPIPPTQPGYQGPTVEGLEEIWVNVTRMVRGVAKAPTPKLLENIIDSYRSGGWWVRGAPVKGTDGLWWQKLVRPKWNAGGVLTIHWRQVGQANWQGCYVDDYTGKPITPKAALRPGDIDWCADIR